MTARSKNLILAIVLLCSGCGAGSVYETSIPGNGQEETLRIEAINEDIIRISSCPGKTVPAKESLVVTDAGTKRTQLKVNENDGKTVLSTKHVSISIDRNDGALSFYDSEGNPVLVNGHTGFSEFRTEENGKTLYSIVQTFDSPADESFYGLGQHQSDDFDYKGKIEELYQFNTKISIPFVYSTKGYGLYLDNYSWNRFGHPESEKELSELFVLRDEKGQEGALSGNYKAADGKILRRREPVLNWSDKFTAAEGLPSEISLDGASVCYDGSLEALESGEYTFNLTYAGYIRMFFDGEEVIPRIWRTVINPNVRRFTVKMEKGRRVPLRIEWEPDGKSSFCALTAYSPLPENLKDKQIWFSEAAPMQDMYFILGDSSAEVIKGLRTISGKAPMMPRWVLGYWQSRDRYRTQEQLLSNLSEFRKRGLPVDNIVLDWNHWPRDKWGCHEFEESRFADPKAMVDSIHALNAHIMVSVWPKFYPGSEHYEEFLEKGWLYEGSIKDSLIDWLGYPYAFYDAYNPQARELFWKQVEDHYVPLGVDAWWMDASEPNVLANVDMAYRKYLNGPTALGSTDEYFNAFALENAKGIFEGEAGSRPSKRPFLLTRSAFAGLQKYNTAAWSGDIGSRWEEMKAQISAGLNFSFCGDPWWTMDIGGYVPENRYIAAAKLYDKNGTENEDLKEWRELYTRWFQFGAFTPIFRSHGQYPLREPWNIAPEGHPAYESIRYYLELRYRLMPYLYTLAGETYLKDATIMRALVMEFPDDPNTRSIGDEFMLGGALLAAPVCKYGARTRTVYLPECEGGWYDYYSGRHYGCGWIEAGAPYERMPLFVRAGSIIPEGKVCESTDFGTGSGLTLRIYAGADAEFALYEDEGDGKDYLKGAYSLIPFRYSEQDGRLSIGDRQGRYRGMSKDREIRIVRIPGDSETAVSYSGKAVETEL